LCSALLGERSTGGRGEGSRLGIERENRQIK
jgi:hypothetical protein